ncbi:MAG: endo-1,4-beta-xylanase [Defluviitaleaceae bacterium]|nr:endo-1,4-beta-xylanase [Defluviitaleaceae bacterium]
MKKHFLSFLPAVVILLTIFTTVNVSAGSEIFVEVDGRAVHFPAQGPVIADGRTLVPVRGVFEELGFIVNWNDQARTATLTRPSHTVIITIGSAIFTTNNMPQNLDVPAQIIGGSTMVPLRAILESVGYYVSWDAGRNTVVIRTQQVATVAPVVITPVPTPTPAPEIPAYVYGVDAREVVYSLADDSEIAGIATDTDISNAISQFTYLQRSGNPTITVATHQGSPSISVTGRQNTWDALDIRISALNLVAGVEYTLEVSGRATSPIPANAEMFLQMYGNNIFPWLDGAGVRTASPSFTLSYGPFNRDTVVSGFPLSSFNTFRIQTNSYAESMSFTVDSIRLVPLEPPLPANRIPSLAEAFSDYFLVGNIWGGWGDFHRLESRGAMAHFLHQYNAVTAENHHKINQITPEEPNFNPETWNWIHADRIVDWANENDLYLKGHVLFWGIESRRWMVNTTRNGVVTNEPLTRAEAISNMEMYVTAVAGRYRGRMDAWEVVNEAFNGWIDHSTWNANPDWRRHLRRRSTISAEYNRNYAPWYDAFANGATGNECGSDFIYYAFRFARIADPYATLMYNDFSEYLPAKREAMAQMVEQINARWQRDPLYDGRLLIEAIGMQGHYESSGDFQTDLNNIRASLQRFAATGARIHITELDVRLADFETSRNGASQGRTMQLTAAQHRRQADMYRNLFALFMEFSNYIDRVSFWGMADEWSWLAGGAPLLHNYEDGNFEPKPAFWAILELVAD